jgi:ubiquinone/menaquinone biosynthesis C-methylase UbiE
MLWTVMPQLSAVLEEVRRVLKPGGHYLVMNSYYKPGEQKFATEIMTCPEDLMRLVPLKPVCSVDVNRLSDHRFVSLLERLP